MSATDEENFKKDIDFVATVASRICLYPFYGRPKYKIYCYYFICFLIFFVSVQQLTALCVYGFKSFLDIVSIAPNIGVSAMSVTKYIKINKNKHIYDSILNHLRSNMWDVVDKSSHTNLKILMKYQKVVKFVTLWYAYYVVPLLSIVVTFPILIMCYDYNVLGKDLEHRYPFEAWYPFDKIKWYYAAYVWESLMTALVVCIYSFSELINVSCIGYICMELRLIGTHLRQLIEPKQIIDLTRSHNVAAVHDIIKRKLRTIILKYNILENILSKLDGVLGDIMLVNYTFGSIFICLTAYTFTVVDELYSTVRFFFFFISLIISILHQCVMGQVISDHSEGLAGELYNSEWTYGDQETKKLVLMFIMRLQKPFQLTAKKYVVMNLNTFTTICSTSYQCFNLLRKMYNPKGSLDS
ncbi:putative odorant receptor 92a isoform X2 [Choristoneura fumiferana]|uniref:putative odorant receptor 92a isoform X2 n=1 Tax=Choristoneura fumiferana TaxID=7141 RepID=UPI003D1572FF